MGKGGIRATLCMVFKGRALLGTENFSRRCVIKAKAFPSIFIARSFCFFLITLLFEKKYLKKVISEKKGFTIKIKEILYS